MKPRTKMQKEVVQAFKGLAPLTGKQRAEAILRVVPHIAKRNSRGQYVCLDCSHSWTADPSDKPAEVVCPHCGARLQVEDGRKKKYTFKDYFMTITRKNGYQVLRMWFLHANYREGMPAAYWIDEAFQRWIAPNGHNEIVSRSRHIFSGYYCDNWNWQSDLDLRNAAYAHTIVPSEVIGRMSLIPEVKRNGFKGSFHRISPAMLFTAILKDNRLETLLKCGQIELLQHFIKSGYCLKFWPSVKVALRHQYKVKDASMWCDLLSSLNYLGKDIHNPKLICPDSLKEAHDYWQHRQEVKRGQERERQERERRMNEEQRYLANEAKMQTDEANYQAAKSRFFDISIGDGEITIKPLQSVREFMDEAARMHHCCFSNRYYAKEQSLILHAIIDGEPVETIEIDLNTLQIVQSRAKYNGMSEYHERIINLMNANMAEVAKRLAA